MKTFRCLILLFLLAGIRASAGEPSSSEHRATLIVVTGIAGTLEYETIFARRSARWRRAGKTANAKVHSIGEEEPNEQSDKERLRFLLETEAQKKEGTLWIVLNGHGTFDGKKGKFNLRGRDVSAEELAKWLETCQRPLAVVNGFSASAPFIQALSKTNRVILSATKSGYEMNYSRFGGYFSESIGNPEADLDKDGQVSLLEAFLTATRNTEEFYSLNGRLASEHALLEDTGDQQGTEADWYQGVRAVKKTKDNTTPDGRRAHQFHLIQSEFERRMPKELRKQRDALEFKLLELRDRKASFKESEYYKKLEAILLQLSEFYATAEAFIAESPTHPKLPGE